MSTLTVQALLHRKRERLGLELLTGEIGMSREIRVPEISSPGLVLTGFTECVKSGRLQVLGESETAYLESLDDHRRRTSVEVFMGCDFPAVFVTRGQHPPDPVLEIARECGIPVFGSPLDTSEFYNRIKPFLAEHFAPTATLHGSLADVYGVGLLFQGKSGIGKSETVLDLVERGHRLVADDLIHATRRGNDVVIGRGHEHQMHHMEIRGVGIIDIRRLFGIRAIRQQKRIEVVVQLETWDARAVYERTGLDTETTEILGVDIPQVVVPLNPGKNITVVSEVVAMNHLLKYSGVDSARRFDARLRDRLRGTREYLEEDDE